jgi:hypothetical protein
MRHQRIATLMLSLRLCSLSARPEFFWIVVRFKRSNSPSEVERLNTRTHVLQGTSDDGVQQEALEVWRYTQGQDRR